MIRLPSPPPGCRRFLAGAVGVLLFAAGCRPAPPGPAGNSEPPPAAHTVTVAFWNLDWFPGQHPHANAEAQARHIAAVVPIAARLDPDVLGLEEIADRAAAEAVIGRLPGFKVDVCSEFLRGPEQKRKKTAHGEDSEPAPDDTPPPTPADYNDPWTLPDHQQIVLCSRLPVAAAGAQPWKPDAAGRRQRRGFVFAVYRIAPGEVMLVYGLHLKSNVVDEPGGAPANLLLRQEAARQLLEHERATAALWARTDRVRLVVLGGDMNTSLDDPHFEAETTLRSFLGEEGFLWGWTGVPLPLRLTLPAKGRYPATCFDHVLYRPGGNGGGVRLVSAAVEPTGLDASDHRPVVVRFAW